MKQHSKFMALTILIPAFAILARVQAVSAAEPWPDWIRMHEEADTMPWAGPPGADFPPDRPARDLYIAGLRALDAFDENSASVLFEAVLAREGTGFIPALWGRAEVNRRRHNADAARSDLAGMVEKHPGFVPAWLTLSYIAFEDGDFEKALNLATEIVNRPMASMDKSNYVRALVLQAGARGMLAERGGLWAKLKHGTSVLRTLRKAESIDPDSPAALVGLGSYYSLAPMIAGGNTERGLKYLLRAVERTPGMPDAHARLAQAYLGMEKRDLAKEHLKKALELDPGNQLALDIRRDHFPELK